MKASENTAMQQKQHHHICHLTQQRSGNNNNAHYSPSMKLRLDYYQHNPSTQEGRFNSVNNTEPRKISLSFQLLAIISLLFPLIILKIKMENEHKFRWEEKRISPLFPSITIGYWKWSQTLRLRRNPVVVLLSWHLAAPCCVESTPGRLDTNKHIYSPSMITMTQQLCEATLSQSSLIIS